jgi:hypothetical protein
MIAALLAFQKNEFLFCSIFDNFQYLYFMTSSGRMTDELERLLKEAAMAQFTYYPGICKEGLRRNMKIPSQDN